MATSQPASMTSVIYGMPQGPTQQCQQSKYLTAIKRTAIIQIIGGILLVLMGIVAIILMAYWSYFATAIWSGMLVYIITGVLGLYASKNGNKCLVGSYLGLSVLGCLMGFALFEMHIFAAIFENDPRWREKYWYSNCQPGGYYSFIPNCAKSPAARQTFDSLICITGFFLFILCIVSASYGCCASCIGCGSCCKKCCCDGGGCSSCCNPTPPPVTAVFPGQGAPVQFVAGMPQGHPQAGMFIVQQGPPPNMQYPQVAMPPPGSTNQGPPSNMQYPQVAMPPAGSTNQGTVSFVMMPPANQGQQIPQPHPSNIVAPPSYNIVGQDQGHAQYPVVQQAPIEEKQ